MRDFKRTYVHSVGAERKLWENSPQKLALEIDICTKQQAECLRDSEMDGWMDGWKEQKDFIAGNMIPIHYVLGGEANWLKSCGAFILQRMTRKRSTTREKWGLASELNPADFVMVCRYFQSPCRNRQAFSNMYVASYTYVCRYTAAAFVHFLPWPQVPLLWFYGEDERNELICRVAGGRADS